MALSAEEATALRAELERALGKIETLEQERAERLRKERSLGTSFDGQCVAIRPLSTTSRPWPSAAPTSATSITSATASTTTPTIAALTATPPTAAVTCHSRSSRNDLVAVVCYSINISTNISNRTSNSWWDTTIVVAMLWPFDPGGNGRDDRLG